jgi:predicted ABC-type ATPase
VTRPLLIVLAGPNGAGKTTFARYNLRSFIETGTFLNADEIAREAHPENVDAVAIKAGRSMLRERRELLRRRVSFCIETTLASLTLRHFCSDARAYGYLVRLVFLFTPYPQLNELRVKQRVMAGGHNVDTDTIRRRHARGLNLLADYWDACDEAIVFDVRTREPVEVARKDAQGVRISDRPAWVLLCRRVRAVNGRALDDRSHTGSAS